MSFFKQAWAGYNAKLNSNPLVVKALTSFTGFTLGDVLAQKFIDPDKEYDLARTLRLASFGLLFHGPSGHFFYGWLDKQIVGTGVKQVMSKVAIDQVVWNPIFGCAFFTYTGLAEGKSMSQIGDKIKADLQTAVMGSWAVWVPAHTINFRFIPSNQRLLYINTIQVGYNIFLSFLANKSAPAPEGVKDAVEAVEGAADKLDAKVESAVDKVVDKVEGKTEEAKKDL